MFALAQALFQQGVEIFQRDIAQHGLCAQIIHGQKRNADQRGQGFLFAEMLGTKRLGKLIGGKKTNRHLLLPKRLRDTGQQKRFAQPRFAEQQKVLLFGLRKLLGIGI